MNQVTNRPHHQQTRNSLQPPGFRRMPALTLQQWSSSSSISFLNVGIASLPSVQYIPCRLTQVLLCPGSCCLRLAIAVTWIGVLYGGIFCSHSEIQEATEMQLQELERLCSCGWFSSCWLVGS